MQKLFAFIFNYRVTFVFLGIELFCLFLVFSKNDYQKTAFVSTSSNVTGDLVSTKQGVTDYFSLDEQNQALAEENARLRNLIIKHRALTTIAPNTPYSDEADKFRVYAAKVVKNSIHNHNNYITINIGSDDGISAGMGVVTESGVVGSVVSCSEKYSLVASVLHSQTLISSKIKRIGTLGSIYWTGRNSTELGLKYIPRHVKLQKGDTVVTSGYNAVYPDGITIGIIDDFELQDNQSFYEIKVELASELDKLNFVYVVENIHSLEQLKLEEQIEQ